MIDSKNKKRQTAKLFATLISLLLIPAVASAMDTFMVGPRATGMGGAGVACSTDTNAQYYNPAAFGFFNRKNEEDPEQKIIADNNNMGRKTWGFDINGAMGYRLHNKFGKYLDDLDKIDYDALSNNGIQDQSDLEEIVRLANDLQGLDDPGNAVAADINGGVGFRISHFAVGVRGFSQISAQVIDLDTTNIGMTVPSGVDVATDIDSVDLSSTSYTSAGYTFQVFDATQQAQLLAALGGDTEAVQRLDYIAAQQGLESSDIQGTVDLLDNVLTESTTTSTNDLDNNTTTVLLKGFGVVEVPVSYGYAINDNISIGGNVKLMRGRVYANEVIVFDDDSGETIEKTDEFYEETTTLGLDLAVMARTRLFQVGLIGRNLNAPKFDGFTKTVPLSTGGTTTVTAADVTIDPQITAGLAFIPFETLTIAADIDITENETVLSSYDTQNLKFGIEWDVFRFLAIRCGAYKNLAESDIGWVYTAGLGLNMWAVRLDISGNYAAEEEQFDNEDYPRESRVAAQLSIDF